MKKYRVVIILFIVIILISTFFIFFSISKNKDKQLQASLDTDIYHLPIEFHPKGLNLVFYADQYNDWEEFDNDVSALMDELKKIAPWGSYQYFNVFRINDPKGAGTCYLKIKDERHPVLRCRDEINEYLQKLPLDRFKLVVLSRQDFQSWANLARIENSGIFHSIPQKLETSNNKKTHGLLFAHLLGHSFGLKDEEYYVIAKAGGAPHTPDGPNCAPSATIAEEWWGDLTKEFSEVGYFKGCCGNENYLKPTETSIMNLNAGFPTAYTYGPASERYLQKVLRYCFSHEKTKYENDSDFFDRYSEFRECL